MEPKLTQLELEELSAFLDGELDAKAAAKVRELIDSDSAWAISYARMQALNGALDAYDIPAASADLASKIIAGVRKTTLRTRLVRWLTPIAAAAAILLAVLVFMNMKSAGPAGSNSGGPTPTVAASPIDKVLEGLDANDRLAVENMDFFRNYDVIDDFDTIEAIDRIEQGQG